MASVEKYISELLYDHDCVIVPQLGGFLASNHSAHLSPASQVIFPPYRSIAFNVYLKQNDGLLANHIVSVENISYTEAVQLIREFTASSFSSLQQGKKFTIAGVGSLFYDKEKNLQFEAEKNTNHLLESFGMDGIRFMAVNRNESPVKKSPAPVKTIRPSISKPEKRPAIVFNKKSKNIAGGIAIAAALVWFSLNLYLVAPKHYESSSLSPFDSQEIIISKSDSIRNTPQSVPVQKQTDTITELQTSASVSSSKPEAVIKESNVDVLPKEKKTTVINNPVTEHHADLSHSNYLIAGVFRIEENAQTLLLQLQQQGFQNAHIIEANEKHYVCYDSFGSREEALAMTDTLQKKKLEGWIWKH